MELELDVGITVSKGKLILRPTQNPPASAVVGGTFTGTAAGDDGKVFLGEELAHELLSGRPGRPVPSSGPP